MNKGITTASEFHRVSACAGYLNLKRKILTSNSHPQLNDAHGDWASAGIDIHKVLKGEPIGRELTEQEEWVVEKAKEMEARFLKQIGLDVGDVNCDVERERRYYLKFGGSVIISGQADMVAKRGNTYAIVDYKSLFGDQEPADANHQLLALSACLYSEVKPRHQDQINVFATIIQPRVTKKFEVVEFSESDLGYATNYILAKVRESAMVDAPRRSGIHCKFCPVSSHCPEGQGMMVSVFSRSGELDTLTGAQLAEIKSIMPAITQVMERVDERIKSMLRADPDSVPGYRLKSVNGRRHIDADTAWRLFKDTFKRTQFLPLIDVRFGDLRETFIAVYHKAKSVTKKAAGEYFDQHIEGHITRSPNEERLAKDK